ncbi:MAG: NfeD family protein [Bacteriovoracaceae bacterium]|jgi:inner membrane protein|nr:NfeD family protein [Bacteriovoracaceae bacterium]
MESTLFKVWLGLGLFCIISEFLLPGLVMVFIGLGSLTVVLAMYLGYLDTLNFQLLTFFTSSMIYLLTLRFLILRFVPTNTHKQDINEDREAIGTVVDVIESISAGQHGRIQYSESSWQAKAEDEATILKGEKATILRRDNITWIVKKRI